MEPTFSVKTIMVTCGLLFMLQAMVVWQVLHARANRKPVLLWTLGALSMGAGLVLFGLRDGLPPWFGYILANALVALSMPLRVEALLVHMQRQQRVGAHLLAVLAYVAVHVWLWLGGHTEARVFWTLSVWTLGSAYLAWQAWQVVLSLRLRSARYMALFEALAAIGQALYMLQMLFGLSPVEPLPQTWALVAVLCLVSLTALWGNLGYLGMVLDQYRRADQVSREAALVQSARAETAERQAQTLRQLMAEREALAEDRERLLRVMTHEVRQPLHNASGVLQSLRLAADGQPPLPTERWLKRLDSADDVLGRVRDVLDNVLQAASLLHRQEPLVLQDTDLAFLIDFCLLELPTAQRERVQVHWRTQMRTVPLAPPLVRLALRNLLRNAFAHGGPGVQVQVNLDERYAPHCLVIAVVDDGPGLVGAGLHAERQAPVGVAPVVHSQKAQKSERSAGQGLGLQIVRQVMALHGGRLSLHNLRGAGLSAAMEWPVDSRRAGLQVPVDRGPAD